MILEQGLLVPTDSSQRLCFVWKPLSQADFNGAALF